jgi:hypothetical protein
MNDGAGVRDFEPGGRLQRQRRSGLLSWCCALSALSTVAVVPPLGKMFEGLLLSGPEWVVVITLCVAVIALATSLYFYLAVVLHLVRSGMGAIGKTIWERVFCLGAR